MLLNIFNNHGISYGLYQVPLLISLNTETRSRMIIFEYTKGELDLIKRLSYIKKYLKRIFRLKSELSHLFFKINKLCREKKNYFTSTNRTLISLPVKFPMLERHPKDEIL